MKKMIVFVLTMVLLFSYATLASAELVFGVSGETGPVDFTVEEQNAAATTESTDLQMVNAELNLVITRLYLEYSQADLSGGSFKSYGLKTGWELGPKFLRAQILGGLQGYDYLDDDYAALGSMQFLGLVGGAGVESKWGKVKFYGSALMSVAGRSTSNTEDDNATKIQNFCAGISYNPLPMLELFGNYRMIDVKSDFIKLDYKGYTGGVKVSF